MALCSAFARWYREDNVLLKGYRILDREFKYQVALSLREINQGYSVTMTLKSTLLRSTFSIFELFPISFD